MITDTQRHHELAWKKNRESGGHFETLSKGQDRLLDTGETFHKQGKHSQFTTPSQTAEMLAETSPLELVQPPGHSPEALAPGVTSQASGVCARLGGGGDTVKRAETVGCRPSCEA